MSIVFAALASCAAVAVADEAPKPWYMQITVDAFASASYTWNFNDPQSNINQLRAFDYDHNSIRIDAAEVVVQKAVANPGDFGFRLDLTMGAVAKVAAARGLFRDPLTGNSQDIDLQQAFASYVIPLGHGLRFDVGKFVTPAGYEVIEGYDGYNDNFSRSLLFTWAIPFTHTGFRFSYPFSDKIAATVMVVNGWDNVIDNNSAKSLGLSLAITPSPAWAIYINYITGAERDHDDSDWRQLIDATVQWKARPWLTLTLNGDYGFDPNAVGGMAATTPMAMSMAMSGPLPGATNAQWVGFAAYARFQASKRFALVLRGEAFWDIDGFRTGTPQRILEATLTPEFHVTDAFILRGDVRVDYSDQFVFERSDGLHRHYQPTAGLNALYVF